MGLVVNFKTIQQPTILVTFFQIREYSWDYRHRGSLIFLLYLPVLFLLLLLLIPVSFKTLSSSAIDREATCHS